MEYTPRSGQRVTYSTGPGMWIGEVIEILHPVRVIYVRTVDDLGDFTIAVEWRDVIAWGD